MYSAAMYAIACLERPRMGMQPFVVRQQRWMDIQHPPFPFGHECWRQNPHKAGKADNVWARRLKRFLQSGFKPRPIFPKWFVINCEGWDIQRIGFSQPTCLWII
jgi:hypothetical protein